MSKWINRHAKLRKHKRILKKKFGYSMWSSDYYTNAKLHEQKCIDEGHWWRPEKHRRNGGYEYWRTCYISGLRGFVKQSTNGVIRARYRNMLSGVDADNSEDIQALQHADYQKYYDFDLIW